MKNRLILAAIAAPLMFGGMQTSALADCTKTGTSVSCDTFDTDTSSDALTLIRQDIPNLLSSFISTYESAWRASAAEWQTNGDWFPALGYKSTSYTVMVNSPKVTNVNAIIDLHVFQSKIADGVATVIIDAYSYVNIDYLSKGIGSYQGSGGSHFVTKTFNVQAVPGPEAGAGLGALAMGGLAVYMKRRRKDEAAA